MLKIRPEDRERWEAMSRDERARYDDAAAYLSETYGPAIVTMRDVESAWAIGG